MDFKKSEKQKTYSSSLEIAPSRSDQNLIILQLCIATLWTRCSHKLADVFFQTYVFYTNSWCRKRLTSYLKNYLFVMMVVFCCGMCLEGWTGISRMAGPGRPGENFRDGWAGMSETAGREISGRPGRDGRAARAVRDANTPARKLLFHPTGRMRAFVHYNPKFSQRFCAMSRLKLIAVSYTHLRAHETR